MTDRMHQNKENMVKDEALQEVNGGLIIVPKTNALNDDDLDEVTGGAEWNWNESKR